MALIAPLHRRTFIRILGAGALDAALGTLARPQSPQTSAKPLRGIFAIAQTPFTNSNQLDLKVLAREVEFIDRGGVHGFVWPQMASEYSTLSKSERLAGAEAILATGKRLRPAMVIGVQAPEVQTAVEYARHAEKLGADAIISLPPSQSASDDALLAYYKEVGEATELPLFAQTTHNMSVALVVRMFREVPTLRYVKDEAGGSPLGRIGQLREQTSDKLKVFTGNHSRTLIDEMQRGSSGSMPGASFADIYAGVWDMWHSGWRHEAIDLFQKAMLFIPEVEAYGIASLKYLLCLRGVFTTYAVRGKEGSAPLDDSAKQTLRDLARFANPYFKCCAVAAERNEEGSHD
jgi:4-hydroxy-tetrahydrodipicolinate synthase